MPPQAAAAEPLTAGNPDPTGPQPPTRLHPWATAAEARCQPETRPPAADNPTPVPFPKRPLPSPLTVETRTPAGTNPDPGSAPQVASTEAR